MSGQHLLHGVEYCRVRLLQTDIVAHQHKVDVIMRVNGGPAVVSISPQTDLQAEA